MEHEASGHDEWDELQIRMMRKTTPTVTRKGESNGRLDNERAAGGTVEGGA